MQPISEGNQSWHSRKLSNIFTCMFCQICCWLFSHKCKAISTKLTQLEPTSTIIGPLQNSQFCTDYLQLVGQCLANVLCSKNVHQLAERLPFQFSIDPNQRLNHLSNTMGYQSNALSNSNALLARTKMM